VKSIIAAAEHTVPSMKQVMKNKGYEKRKRKRKTSKKRIYV